MTELGAGLSAELRRRGVTATQAVLVLVLALLVGGAIGAGIHLLGRGQSPPAQATAANAANAGGAVTRSGLLGEAVWAPGARPAPAITTLRDQTGHRFDLAALRGRTVAVEFFDSHCHQECPLAGRALAAAESAVPAAQRPVLVVVSVNPLDTPASVRAAARSWGLAGVAPWHWLMGSHAALAPVWSAYHISVVPQQGDISHTEALYLVDRHGDERAGYLYPYMPASVAHDLRLLARSSSGRTS